MKPRPRINICYFNS
uniref:Uncharacterized protein n=1 Tax=Rhizophora mucronata TaxID=61149 RepID=A0A2P2N6L9_RHIMU